MIGLHQGSDRILVKKGPSLRFCDLSKVRRVVDARSVIALLGRSSENLTIENVASLLKNITEQLQI